jgi:hypothetical protein
MIRLYSLLAQVPFPNGSNPVAEQATSTNVSQTGAASAALSLEGSKAAAGLAVKTLNGLWELYTTPSGVYWITLIRGLAPLLILGFFFWAFTAVFKWNTSGRRNFPWDALTPVIIVIFLFAKNGTLLSGMVQVAHFLPTKINTTILDTAVQGITGREMIQKTNAKNAYNQTLKEKGSACVGQKDQDKCYENAKNDATAQAENANRGGLPIQQPNLNALDIALNPVKTIASGFKLQMIGATIAILTVLAYGSHLFFGLIQVLWASLAPIFTALHLVPNAPNLKVFFSGFIGISLAIIFNSAFQVGTAMLLATASDWDPLLLPIMNGFLGIIFSGFIAYLGITGVYATIGTVASGGAKLIKMGKK